ncbi:S-adenosyl-L-methionine-dependent methyltransferase [Microstroma glucosiphilum]|uniref:Trimethylguanosine synthase n=1 Tax=Pseudomicrostroma glucosiphilum TaxID=1684307 RepID=A0A316UGM9_9BASI|nr:S-adenosyl-L-methionine-dependent methyltransferase [Pseudomicrostroma glucosiphilum]PWN23083.1 S-adenosyl-L-methionine-dependent methyltransferase [Pseudomicrostroma glucosiphilum]
MTTTNISATSKAKKRKRHSSDAGEQSTSAGIGQGASTSTINGKGKGRSETLQVRTATVSARPKTVDTSRDKIEKEGEEASEQDWRSRAITEAKKMPKEMTKYWYSRYRLFSRFDEGVLMDAQSWFSVTPEVVAARIASRCLYPLLHQQPQGQKQPHRSKAQGGEVVILDLFCGAGGNAIQFALAGMEDEDEEQEQGKSTTRIIAVDIDPDKIEYARHNARIYGVEERIHFLVGDAVEFVQDWKKAKAGRDGKKTAGKKKGQTTKPSTSRWEGEEKADIDVVFLSPPWGGVDYQNAGMPPVDVVSSSPLLLGDGQDGDQSTGQVGSAPSTATPLDEVDTSASLAASLPAFFSTPQLIREKELALPTGEYSTLATEEAEGERQRKAYAYYPLSSLLPLPGQELYDLARSITPNVALYLPRNCDLWEIAKLTGRERGREQEGEGEGEQELIAVEEQFLGSGLKALAVYCGALASDWEE